ncbi:MAG TPA: prepilin-type N-terminal cleavage/methylation domain-containing protein [Archangium sp.]|uniref:GspH/FimT family pseudopilin n=1 Tax=Archangium sp. TaxID=1872627 RepID=UPI002ED9B225
MSNHVNPAKREGRDGGYTLLELMITLAIVSILAGLSVMGYAAVGRRGALQNVSFDLQGVMGAARTRAVSRGHPVWVVLFPAASHKAKTGGLGAFMVVEDRNGGFMRSPLSPLELPLVVDDLEGVSETYFLEDYSKKVRFGALTPGRTDLFGAPFSGMTVQTCSFCSGADHPRGAIVFLPDGGARFVDGQGTFLSTANQTMAFSSLEGRKQHLFAISGPAGYMASFAVDKL